MNMKKISHEMNLKKWAQIVEECRSSGQTAVSWCAEREININILKANKALIIQ